MAVSLEFHHRFPLLNIEEFVISCATGTARRRGEETILCWPKPPLDVCGYVVLPNGCNLQAAGQLAIMEKIHGTLLY